MVSKSLVDRGLVRAAGILAEPVNESDHNNITEEVEVVG